MFDSIEVTSFFNLVLAYNPGGAFSMFASDSPNQGLLMTALSCLAMIPLGWFLWQAKPEERGLMISLGIVFGGALGNVHDRIRYGVVVDFLDFHWGSRHWPAFNIADVAICVGLGFLILISVLTFKQTQRADRREGAQGDSRGDNRGPKRRKDRKGVNPKSPTRI
jgi:signal peptidase II